MDVGNISSLLHFSLNFVMYTPIECIIGVPMNTAAKSYHILQSSTKKFVGYIDPLYMVYNTANVRYTEPNSIGIHVYLYSNLGFQKHAIITNKILNPCIAKSCNKSDSIVAHLKKYLMGQ